MTDDEIRKIWIAAGELATYGTLVRLMIVTAQRKTMTAAIRPDWVANGTITFPASVCKNNTDQIIPVTSLTQQLLDAHSFPGSYNAWSKPKARLDTLSGVDNWVHHDFRRYFATTASEHLAAEPHIVEIILHHQTGTLTPLAKIYNKARYTKPVRETLNAYDATFHG